MNYTESIIALRLTSYRKGISLKSGISSCLFFMCEQLSEAREGIRLEKSLGGLWTQRPAHPIADFKLGQACPRVTSSFRILRTGKISQPLMAHDAMQLLCHDEIIFLGIPSPDPFNILILSLLFCCIPTSKPWSTYKGLSLQALLISALMGLKNQWGA